MKRLPMEKQMNILLSKDQVTEQDIKNLAKKIAGFHKSADVIYNKDYSDVQSKFNDIEAEKTYLQEQLQSKTAAVIEEAIRKSGAFHSDNAYLLKKRLQDGFYRDCHGDLHSRNIFLLPEPVPFDCIEFNDDFRQTDILNDIAFLCMDLDAFGRQDLSDLFFSAYNQFFPAATSTSDHRLFVYYKSYRANIRAKVNSLRARSAKNEREKATALKEAGKYLNLVCSYLDFGCMI